MYAIRAPGRLVQLACGPGCCKYRISISKTLNDGDGRPGVAEQRRSLSTGEALSLVLSPSHLGAQLFEAAHTATGLPWWASIPITALGVRTALLPFSIKARGASTNLLLLNAAFAQVPH